jgi:glycosyltransferase involved in cell wall biosynthesis
MGRPILRVNAREHYDGFVRVDLPLLPGNPLVSVLIANYNHARYVGEAIQSVQDQTYQNSEVIICDDGSSDNSCEVIQGYAQSDRRIVVIRKTNGGQGSAINRAFSEARGEIVCILDADDAFEPVKLARVVDAFTQNPEAGLLIHDLMLIDGEGRRKGFARYTQEGYLGPEIPTLRMGLPIPQASGLSFRKEVLEEILPLPEDHFRSVADWAMGYAAAYITKTTLVPEVLARYRIHGTNTSGTTSTASKLDEEMVAGILNGMDRVITFVDQFVRTKSGISVPASQVRNILEHRLMLGFLRRDKQLITCSARDLRLAYKTVRRDYPGYRYLFWELLSLLPTSASQCLLVLAFNGFQFRRRLANVF